jgi:hypothetical protein
MLSLGCSRWYMHDAMKLAYALAAHHASTIPMARKWNIASKKKD